MTTILDQHFLTDAQVLETINLTLGFISQERVLEIGGGKGILTQKIIEKNPKSFTCVEIDEELYSSLQIQFSGCKYTFINDNAIPYLQSLRENDFTLIIANLPYSLTQAVYTQLLYIRPKRCVFLQPHSFTKKIYENISKQSQLINSMYSFQCIETVGGVCFTPRARTTSSIVELIVKQEHLKSKKEQFLSSLSRRYNQQFNNAVIFSLAYVLNIGKKDVKLQLEKNTIEMPKTRVSVISNEEFNNYITLISQLFFTNTQQ